MRTAEDPAEAPGRGFEVHLDNFEGPFDLLLRLIAQHRLDVTQVALAVVTDDFIRHVRLAGELDLEEATGFVVVAATLLDLKAARLLPGAEVDDEQDLADLEARDLLFARLLQYRAYRAVADDLARRLADNAGRVPRTRGVDPELSAGPPPLRWTHDAHAFARLAAEAMAPKPPPEVATGHLHAPPVAVAAQRQVILDRLHAAGSCRFSDLVADAPDGSTVVARFLAVLELYRDGMLGLHQDGPLGDLVLDAAPGAAATGAIP